MSGAVADTDHKAAPAAEPYPSAFQGWRMVAVLTVVYVLSFIDRYILGLLAEPVKADLNLTDTQLGLLLGPSFAIFYALMGLPLGWAADRKRRTWIVAAGVALWSLATALSGLARNFWQLFLARMSVGVGEAALSPCAMSLIADSFPAEKRGRPIAFYSTALSLGAGVAALTGAAVIGWATSTEAVVLPGVGALAPWQLTLIIVGLPGLLMAPVVFFLPEPKRRKDTVVVLGDKNGFVDVLKYVGARWALFASFVSVFCFMIIIGYSTSWGAALFSRTWGWSPVAYGQAIGLMFLIVGPLTVNAAGWLSDHFYARGVKAAPILIPLAGVPIMIIGGVAWPLMPSGELAVVLLAFAMIGSALASATGVTALLNIIPPNIRGQTIALYYMTISFFGLGFGPLTVGLLNDYVFGAAGLRYSMAMLPLIYGLPVLALAPVTLRLYRRELARMRMDAPAPAD